MNKNSTLILVKFFSFVLDLLSYSISSICYAFQKEKKNNIITSKPK